MNKAVAKSQLSRPTNTISATEVAQYTHCPHQWYYQRQYGTAHLRALKREHNQTMGYTDSSRSLFHRGQQFHKHYTRRDRLRKLASAMVALAVIVLVVLLLTL